MKKFLYVFEFSDDPKDLLPSDTLWNAVRDKISEKLLSEKKVQFKSVHGVFRTYRGKGFSTKRVVNFIWMHLFSVFEMITFRPDFVFVRTTPPLIQITYLILGKIFRAKVYVWLMDYHPVFGLRTSAEKSFKHKIWAFFDKLDRFALKYAEAVVCLDYAMESLVRERCKNARTFVCPTFSGGDSEFLDLSKICGNVASLSLLYSGNLGKAHKTQVLENLMRLLSKKTRVVLSYCGNSEDASSLFEAVCKSAGAEFKRFPRVENYALLGRFYKENGFDYGIVLMDDRLAGVLSPSKFSGYLSFGLPILNIGPSGTNADYACSNFKAGVSLNAVSEIYGVAELLLNAETQPRLAKNARKTLEYFGEGAVDKLASFFVEEIGKSS